ncbi:MAG: hypothetical protein ACRYG8_30635 [Janthinobacterium lividum]
MHLTFYWVYDLPNWLFCLLTMFVFVAFGVAGLWPSRKWVRRQHQINHSHNDIVGYYLAAVTVFYGITLGLVAVGTWTTYSDVGSKADREAEVVSSLYRDVDGYPEPTRGGLRGDLEDYVQHVIVVSWPLQRQGIVPTGSAVFLERFQTLMLAFNPATPGQQVLHAESFKQFNNLVEARRARLNAVTTGLPGALWALVILGALISITVTLFFDTQSLSMHFWMTVLMSTLLGLMVFLIATLDNPFRGKVSVGPDALSLVYAQVMHHT